MGFRTQKARREAIALKVLFHIAGIVAVFGLFLYFATMDARAAVLFSNTAEFENIKMEDLQINFQRNPRITAQAGIGTTPTKIKIKLARFGTSADVNCKYRFDAFRYFFLPGQGDFVGVGRDSQPMFSGFDVVESTMPTPGTFVELTIPIDPSQQFAWNPTDFIALEFGNNSCTDRAPVLFKGLQSASATNFIIDDFGIVSFSCTLGDFSCSSSLIAFTIEDDVPPPVPPVIDEPVDGFISVSGLIDVSGACLSGTGFETIVVVGESQEFGVQDIQIADCENGFFDLEEFFPLQLFSGTSTISAIACTDITATSCSVKSNEVTGQILFGGEEPIDPAFTDPDFGFLGNALFNVLKFLFLPGEDIFQPLTNLIDLIKTKPPLGFFGIVETSLGSIGNTSPAFALQGTASLSTILTPLKIGISFILWTLFVFWLWRKITALNI